MSEHCWMWVTETANVPPREGRAVVVGGREIAIFNLGDRFVATDNACPHRGGPLADGIVAGETVVCPLHGWKINLTTGRVDRPGGEAGCIRTYPTHLDNGVVVLGLPAVAHVEHEPGEAA